MNRENKELPSTYVVFDRQNTEELQRLILQDRMITNAMGGVLAEQQDPNTLHRILDVACGPGGWCIEVSKQYPDVQVFGIDISHKRIAYAREQAIAHGVADRVEFSVMDALSYLAYPREFFDLVNLRFGISFVRIWEWRKICEEMLRVTKEGGIIRITETSIVHQSSSPSLTKFQQACLCALQHAGYLPEFTPYGLTKNIASLMSQNGVHQIQTKPHCIPFHAGTQECDAYIEDVSRGMRMIKPFLHKWGCLGEDYEQVCQIAQTEMRCSEFQAIWELSTVWGQK